MTELVRARIELEVPEYQIGQPVTMYFKDTMQKFGICDPEPVAQAEIEGDARSTWWYVCGECHTVIGRNDKYCRECGRRIVWDE